MHGLRIELACEGQHGLALDREGAVWRGGTGGEIFEVEGGHQSAETQKSDDGANGSDGKQHIECHQEEGE
jgi:hypothetical protein